MQQSWQFVSLRRTPGILVSLMPWLPAFGLSAPIATSLVAGGPAVMVWGYVTLSYTFDFRF
jgi:acyl-CoA synthetase (AMP-forming)/AMP-acid ligase II